MHLLAATSEQTRNLELFQLQRDEGPCLDCYRSGQYVGVADLRQAATPARGARHPGVVRRRDWHPYPRRPRTRASVGPRPALAIVQDNRTTDQAAALLGQLRVAVVSRGLLEMAKGVLAEEYGLDMDAAFARLRHYARTHEQPAGDSAVAG